jgi:hypothetical protein
MLVTQINSLVHKLNTLGTNALNTGMAKVDMQTELAKLRQEQRSSRCTS